MSWRHFAEEAIERAHAALPSDVSFNDRKAAIIAAYPFGPRAHHPYKIWLDCQRRYLTKFAQPTLDTKRFPLSPLEKAIARAQRLASE